MTREQVYQLIDVARVAQENKHGPHTPASTSMSDSFKLVILAEEFGEVARAICDSDPINLKAELIDVAAVCVAWAESFEGESND